MDVNAAAELNILLPDEGARRRGRMNLEEIRVPRRHKKLATDGLIRTYGIIVKVYWIDQSAAVSDGMQYCERTHLRQNRRLVDQVLTATVLNRVAFDDCLASAQFKLALFLFGQSHRFLLG